MTKIEKQCEQLGIPFQTINSSRNADGTWCGDQGNSKSPETIVRWKFEEQGWSVTQCEGGPILLAMKCAGFDWLAPRNLLGKDDAITRFLEAQITIADGNTAGFIQCINDCTMAQFEFNFEKIYSATLVNESYQGIRTEFMIKLFGLQRELIVRIAEIFVSAPYDYRSGWPDLTMMKGSEINFVEVKTTDSLHASQIRIFNDFAIPLGLSFSVSRLVSSKP